MYFSTAAIAAISAISGLAAAAPGGSGGYSSKYDGKHQRYNNNINNYWGQNYYNHKDHHHDVQQDKVTFQFSFEESVIEKEIQLQGETIFEEEIKVEIVEVETVELDHGRVECIFIFKEDVEVDSVFVIKNGFSHRWQPRYGHKKVHHGGRVVEEKTEVSVTIITGVSCRINDKYSH